MKRVLKPGNMLNPTPVVMVSCGSHVEEFNIITIAWTGTICSDPPLCYISVRPERHSYNIIKRTGCFVINLVTEALAAKADWTGVKSGSKYNKFVEKEFTPIEAQKVEAPLIAESPINIECIVKDIIPLGTHDMFIAEVVSVSVDDALFNPKTNAIVLKRANLITYSHGQYFGLGKILGKFGFSVQKR
ncbi:MAG: flavin reductase family protein [Bacteroidales bacterium]|nr:flavin reductase family protein [Bacteroidales bacterium]